MHMPVVVSTSFGTCNCTSANGGVVAVFVSANGGM